MISFDLTQQQLEFQELARTFAKDVVRPTAAKHDADSSFPIDEIRQAFRLGLLTAFLPKDYGGLELPMIDQVIIDEELGWGCKGFWAAAILPLQLALQPLIKFGTTAQKERWLPGFAKELRFASFALTEPSGGSDFTGHTTKAIKRGNSYVISGTKQWISNAAYADLFTVIARVSDGKSNTGGLSVFLVPKTTPGITLGQHEDKMGSRCADTRTVTFEECVVDDDMLVGGEGKAPSILDYTLSRGRPKVASAATGVLRAALEYASRYATERRVGGKTIVNYQLIQLKLAEMAKDLLASRLLIWNACWRLDNGLPAKLEVSTAKCFATDAAVRGTTEAIQVLGANGYIRGYGVEKLLRDVKVTQIGEGTNEIQRLIIASEVIRKIITNSTI